MSADPIRRASRDIRCWTCPTIIRRGQPIYDERDTIGGFQCEVCAHA